MHRQWSKGKENVTTFGKLKAVDKLEVRAPYKGNEERRV